MKTDDPRSADLTRRAFCLGTAALTVSAVAPGLSAASRGNLYLDDVTFALDEIEKKCAHFFELKGIDWKDVRRRFTLEARKVRNAQQHLQLLVRLLARLLLALATLSTIPDDWHDLLAPDSSRLAGKTAASAICHEGRRSVLASIHREGQTMIRMPAQRRDGSQSVRSRIANKEIH